MFHQKMIPPSTLVMFNPIIVGFLFVVEALVDLLASALVSGAQVKSLHTNKPILVHWKFQILS
jgi:Na+/H+-translocating membrane pyrophosphatase